MPVSSFKPLLLVAALTAGPGCAPRRFLEPPPASPASESAPSAALPETGKALTEEPPLPGEDTSGWPGLEEEESGSESPADADAGHEGSGHRAH